MTAVPTGWLRARLPARTIRLRLTLVYGGLFLCSGAAVLAITYVLARHQYTGSFFISSGRASVVAVAQQGGTNVTVDPSVPGQIGFPPSAEQIAAAAHAQSSAALNQLLIDSAIGLAIMAVLSIWLGWVIAGRALRPLRTITNTAREISASNLHRRLAVHGPDDELTQLATTFDDLLARLEAAFEAQRRFVANASHELRTPLTLERTLLEVALGDPEANAESFRRTCEQLLGVGEQQERLIEALLTLSRSQRGLDRRELVDLAAVAAAAVAAAHRNGLAFETAFEPARTSGDARLIERLAANLVANAVIHNVPGGSVTIDTRTRNGSAVLRVANSGRPIRPDEIPRLLRPFERLEGGRTGESDGVGVGLGLSIVDAIAQAHEATLTATPRPGGGLDVEVAFSAAAESD